MGRTEAERWTDEQAADAALSCLPDDFEVTVAKSWFRPHEKRGREVMPSEHEGRSEWVSRRDHADAILALGRAVLRLRAERDLLAAHAAKLLDALAEEHQGGPPRR